jgi:DNA topoisomerase IB
LAINQRPAKKYYIHPAVFDCYSAGNLREVAEKFRESSGAHLYEQIVLSLLTPLKRARAKAA